VPYPTAWVVDVASASWNDVNVKVRDRLTRRLPNVQSDIETLGGMALKNSLPCGIDGTG
jgi:hypothetical protein